MRSDSAILERVINSGRGDFSPELARHVLSFDFPPGDHARYAELSARAGEGLLNDEERAELDEYLDVNDFLTIIKAKARASIGKNPAA